MNLPILAAEHLPLPDPLIRAGIARQVARLSRSMASQNRDAEARFAQAFGQFPIAQHTREANDQHYELPEAFFGLTLGPARKYSSCLYVQAGDTLAQAERNALVQTCLHAELRGARDILELGCGWGSLSLHMAKNFPEARIVSVSNSASQRAYIEAEAARQGLQNLRIITADMNDFAPDHPADRIVSVEMFEHMANWRELLTRAKTWLKPDGKLFLHVFAHATTPYRFDHTDQDDWIAQHFFTGGIMPSHGLIRQFPDLFDVEAEWRWSGEHYQKTAQHWLANFDSHQVEIRKILKTVYGAQASVWYRRWRLFYLATAGLFGHASGTEWAVSHYRLTPNVR